MEASRPTSTQERNSSNSPSSTPRLSIRHPSPIESTEPLSPEPTKDTRNDEEEEVIYVGSLQSEPGTYYPFPIKVEPLNLQQLSLRPNTTLSLMNSTFHLKNTVTTLCTTRSAGAYRTEPNLNNTATPSPTPISFANDIQVTMAPNNTGKRSVVIVPASLPQTRTTATITTTAKTQPKPQKATPNSASAPTSSKKRSTKKNTDEPPIKITKITLIPNTDQLTAKPFKITKLTPVKRITPVHPKTDQPRTRYTNPRIIKPVQKLGFNSRMHNFTKDSARIKSTLYINGLIKTIYTNNTVETTDPNAFLQRYFPQ